MYISSTFQDLQEARRQVSQTIRRMQHTDVAMEYYGAEDVRPLDKCLADVDACDLYICVVAWRYGFVPDGETRSITELEYARAVASDKPRLLFLLSEEAPWPMNRAERSPEAMGRLAEFRSTLERDRICDKFMDEVDLSKKVGEAIHRWERQQGRHQGSADWETYRRAMFEAHRWVKLAVIAGAKQDRRFAEIPLTDVFVPQPVRGGSPEYEVTFPQGDGLEEAETDEAVEGALGVGAGVGDAPVEQIWDVLGRERRQVFLGAPGSGKSTLLLDALLQLCDTERGPDRLPANLRHAPLPFLIELRQYVLDPATNFVDYIAATIGRRYGVHVDAEHVRGVLNEHDRVVVMFDGLDEVFDPHTQSQVIEEFRQFSRTFAGCRLVVTSRIAGYSALELERDEFHHYTVLGFGMPEVREFVPKWYRHYTWQGDERDAQGLIRRVSESPRLLELAGNPLLLTMMAVIYKHHDLPEKRLQLYKRCTEVLLEDWEVKRKKISRDESLPLGFPMVAEQKAELLQQVSMYMLEHQRVGSELNAIAREPLLGIIAAYLQSEYHKSPGEARAVASEILDHLRERTYVIAEVGEQRFGFVHRTFMEFFAALHCKAEFNRREADYDWLTRELFGAHWRKSEWREVLLLLIAMLKEQDSPVRKVIEHVRAEEVTGLPVQLGFAARALAEVGATDDAWSRQLVHDLVEAISATARQQTDAHTANAFLDDALGSFSVLASTVTLRKTTRKVIDSLAVGRTIRSKMIGFQLQLALRTKDERRAFALESLTDSQESVRRGAIAALEREWPGRQDVAVALADVVRSDRIFRVRMSALQALDRSWPHAPEILDAIGARAQSETAYTVIIDLVSYMARRWGGDERAFNVLLSFCGAEARVRNPYIDAAPVRNAFVRAVVDGWRGRDDCAATLRARWLSTDVKQSVATALAALAAGWSDDPDTREWILGEIVTWQEVFAWPGDAYALAVPLFASLLADPEAASWMLDKIEDVGLAVRVRRWMVRALAASGGDTAVLEWIEQRLRVEPDADVRVELINAWSNTPKNTRNRDSVLEERVADDEDGRIRAHAFMLLFDVTPPQEQEDLTRRILSGENDPSVRQQILFRVAVCDSPWSGKLLVEQFAVEDEGARRKILAHILNEDSFEYYGVYRGGYRVDPDYFSLDDKRSEDEIVDDIDDAAQWLYWPDDDEDAYLERAAGLFVYAANADPSAELRSLAAKILKVLARYSSTARRASEPQS
ncbi:DUF4062 domain-containing protein [Streptomyces sp. NBC_00663]|uniref:DUF4062 domain-containing protein n=1 Tax=Streptomyces sp. NBC_00663 TaxID=2975801 RepID=UPI002E337EC0|nr:DUF4062 domain-containing protein [Streptomyces sp. NBC_00663]